MTNTPNDGSFAVFGESEGEESVQVIGTTSGLEKNKVIATVIDGTLELGIRGAGEGNTAPGGNWIVFDNFEVKMKSVIPLYVTPEPTPAQMLVTDIQTQKLEPEIKYWQSNQRLHVQSTDAIVKYSVYSLTGAMIEHKETRSNTLSIPMRNGIYIVRVLTENGTVDTEKVSIR
jgi:hypothetical protein